MTKRVALYVRVSTDGQALRRQSVGDERRSLRRDAGTSGLLERADYSARVVIGG